MDRGLGKCFRSTNQTFRSDPLFRAPDQELPMEEMEEMDFLGTFDSTWMGGALSMPAADSIQDDEQVSFFNLLRQGLGILMWHFGWICSS